MKYTLIFYNSFVLAIFALLAIIFNKWWIIFFALFFIAAYITNEAKFSKARICDKCHRRSETATTAEEAIARAVECGWKHINEGDLDYCPDCLRTMNNIENN